MKKKYSNKSDEDVKSKIISNSGDIYLMFGINDRKIKDARIRCVLNNRTK